MSFLFRSGNGGEDAAGDDIALDLGEPQLDLVEPRGVRRREVQANVADASARNSSTRLGFVRRQIVGDDVDLFAAGWWTTMSMRKATNSADVCRAAVLPSTSPVLVLKAAYSDSVP